MAAESSRPDPIVPFSIEIDVLDRMLNFEIADHPIYQGLEIQGFDDPGHGAGITVFVSRREDDTVDVYYQSGLDLDPQSYEIGGGLRKWTETEFDVARLEITPRGANAEIGFTDVDGRSIEIRVSDRTRRPRRTAGFLAPMGAAISDPRSLPLVWMSKFDLLRRNGDAPVIRIDGHRVAPGRLPAEWLLRRRLIKVAADLCIVSVNAARTAEDPAPLPDAEGDIALGPDGLQALRGSAGGHEVVLEFDPPCPVHPSPAVAAASGAWQLDIDETPVIAGTWSTTPADGQIHVAFDVTRGWRPRGLPPLMRFVTRVVPVFRRWPTTYRWTGVVTPGDEPAMVSRWERTDTDIAQSYRSFSGTD